MTDTNILSRRAVLGGLAGTGTALVACGDDAPLGPDADVTTLNALLSAEYGAIAAYTAGLSAIMSAPGTDPLSMYSFPLQAIASRWKDQHTAHSTQLQTLIRALRGVPVVAPITAFMPPMGFTPTIRNVLVLACNAERAAAVAYANAIATGLKGGGSRGLAGSIEGDETQHFIVLYAFLNGALAAGPMIATGGTNDVVPQAFVTRASGLLTSLQDVPDFTF